MNIEREVKKQKALEIMKKMDIYKPYIKGFEQRDEICMYENYAGFWAYQYPELEEKIKQIEEKYNCLVYGVTHEYTQFGECYSLLIITDYKREWKDLFVKNGLDFITFAYVWNIDEPDFSEFGSIAVHSFGGGLRRVG